jgi:hypothetical protein
MKILKVLENLIQVISMKILRKLDRQGIAMILIHKNAHS